MINDHLGSFDGQPQLVILCAGGPVLFDGDDPKQWESGRREIIILEKILYDLEAVVLDVGMVVSDGIYASSGRDHIKFVPGKSAL